MFPRTPRVFPKATFELYENEVLEAVGLAREFRHPEIANLPFEKLAQPISPPRPFAINETQALAVRLALVQYYRQRGWAPGMTDTELGSTYFPRQRQRREYARGFIIGDGTGVGKTREIAAFALSVIIVERAVQELALRHNTVNMSASYQSSPVSHQPLLLWLTCSESLFQSCKDDIRAVLVNTNNDSWSPDGFPDAPSSYDPATGITTVDLNGRDMFIQFLDLKRLKQDECLSKGVVAMPTVLFMTYAGLMCNLEQVLDLLVGRGRPIMERRTSILAPLVTAVLCDEFHKPKAISEDFRKTLQQEWDREDATPAAAAAAAAATVWRFCYAMMDAQTTKRRKKGKDTSKDSSGTISRFLADLGQADSFRLFLELTKYHSFYLMASATPFQSNEDLHSVDHIIRSLLPSYTNLPAFNYNYVDTEAVELVEDREYATEFLEDLVKLMHNQGLLVSRAISMHGVECAVVRCPISPVQSQAFDSFASYMSEARMSLANSDRLSFDLADEIEKLELGLKREGRWSNEEFRDQLDTMVIKINHRKINKGPLSAIAPFFKVVVVDDAELWVGGASSCAVSTTEHVFNNDKFFRLAKQFVVNVAGLSVAVCKASLLTMKAKAVVAAIQRLRRSSSAARKKVVVAIEQTGDAFLANLVQRTCDSLLSHFSFCGEKKILELCEFDASPIANTVSSLYKLLFQAVAIRSTLRVLPLATTSTCILLVPRLPPAWPLVALGGNFLDVIEQHVGEWRHSEITNRKFKCRWSRNGMLIINPNSKSANTLKSVRDFNDTTQVDVMVLGPKGNTGLSLHDSRDNTVAARRIHFIVDLPYNPIAFRQCIGRTHRNGQASTPAFLVFSTDAAAERRFFDCLERRVKDSTAGSFGDRYSKNTVNVAAAETLADVSDVNDNERGWGVSENSCCVVDKEQFLDHELSLAVIGNVVRIVVSDISPLQLFTRLGEMGFYEEGRFVFVEGLDLENGLFIETLIHGLCEAATILGHEHKDDYAATNVMHAAGKVLESNLVQKAMWCKDNNYSLPRLKVAADRLFSALEASKNTYMRDELLSATETGALRMPSEIIKNPIVTIRIVGTGKTPPNILPAVGGRIVPDKMLKELPLIAATRVLSAVAVEYPTLILRTLIETTPHARSWGTPSSFMLNMARKLSSGKINSKQFHNQYFSPAITANLMKDLFSVVRSILARDPRLDALCDSRVYHIINAQYVNVDKVSTDDFSVKVLLSDGTHTTLTPQNSVFANSYFDYFKLKNNAWGNRGRVVQVVFENCGDFHMPPRAMLTLEK